ncbi:MAG: four helix bundle protein [Candidatus Hydrogenedentes bacterium]|nr:four helix bundle protein [Candidatus Hydrogenedentota bacterium]
MNERQFKERTYRLALRIIRLVEALPKTATASVIAKQLIRSGTSIGANYRAACRGRSAADVIARLGIVEEEADETLYWLELPIEADVVPKKRLEPLMKETTEILAMTVASIKTLRRSAERSRTPQKAERYFNPKSKIQNPK